jgi:hypothetical protein
MPRVMPLTQINRNQASLLRRWGASPDVIRRAQKGSKGSLANLRAKFSSYSKPHPKALAFETFELSLAGDGRKWRWEKGELTSTPLTKRAKR